MAKLEQSYESIIIVSTKVGEEGTKALVEKFTKRRLAYPINYEHEGYYVKFDFTSGPDFPAELDRIYKITEGVIRSLIVAL